MNYEKDSQNQTDNKSYSQTDIDKKPIFSSTFSAFATKKTEKLVTALYMVTDYMESSEALKSKLRTLGINLLSDIHEMTLLRATDKHLSVSSSQSRISEILSFLDIAFMIGFVSEMNANIIKKEFQILLEELAKYQDKNQSTTFQGSSFGSTKVSHFSINKDNLSVPLPTYEEAPLLPSSIWKEEVIDKGHSIKDNNKEMSFIKRDSSLSYINKTQNIKSPINILKNREDKSDRKEKILNLIKAKREVSIKDISYEFTDCSEKTIQRELNDLVLKGRIKKTGSKRWSKYHSV